MKNNRATQALAALKDKPPQTEVEIMRGLTMRVTSGGVVVARLHYSANPERDPDLHPEWKIAERKAYPSQAAWDREQEIIDEAGGGELAFAEVLLKYWHKIVIEDPHWRPDDPEFVVRGGFDYGKINATALVRCYHDFDGTMIYAGEYYEPGLEIWQHAPVIKQMSDFRRMETIYADPTMFNSTSQQSQRPGHAAEIAKSYNELYCEAGIESLFAFHGDRSDVSFAARLMMHWADLDNREPTVKIFCPKGCYAGRPVPGLWNWGCPNLLWELMNTRRVKLSAQQLQSRNRSEAIVDKDNHARDAMKYHLMSHPEPSEKRFDRRVSERLAQLAEVDPTTAVANFPRIMQEEQQSWSGGIHGAGNLRRFMAWERRRRFGR
jgi:hypothetical protein